MKPGLEKVLLDNLDRFRLFAAARLKSKTLAEDVVQDSLLKALGASESLVDEEKVMPWFYQIMRGTMIDLFRKTRAAQKREKAWAENQDEKQAVHGETCRCMHALIPTLKPEYGQVLRSLDLEGVTPVTLANQLGISLGNLKVRRHRARTQLKQRLQETCRVCAKHGCLDCTCRGGA